MREGERGGTEHRHAPILGLPWFAVLGHTVTEGFNMPRDRLGNVLPGDGTHAGKTRFDLAQFVDGNFDTTMDGHTNDGSAEASDAFNRAVTTFFQRELGK